MNAFQLTRTIDNAARAVLETFKTPMERTLAFFAATLTGRLGGTLSSFTVLDWFTIAAACATIGSFVLQFMSYRSRKGNPGNETNNEPKHE